MNNEKIKVLVLNKGYVPWTGGIETVVKQICKGLPRDKYETEVLACHKNSFKKTSTELKEKIKVTKLLSLGSVASTPVAPSYIFSFKQKVRQFDIIHMHVPFPLGVIALASTKLRNNQKLIITFHADPQMTRWKNLFKYYAPILYHVLNKADRIIVTAPGNKRFPSLVNYQGKTSVIPLASGFCSKVDSSVNSQSNLRKELQIEKDEKVILFVGRLAKYKGLEYLLEAMKNINGKALIVGTGDLKNNLKNQAKHLGVSDKIIFTGYVEDEVLPLLYRLSDIFVLPSINEGEAFGIVQVEAMNYGLPVINTSLDSGVPFVSLHNKSGITVPPKSSKALSNAN